MRNVLGVYKRCKHEQLLIARLCSSIQEKDTKFHRSISLKFTAVTKCPVSEQYLIRKY